MPPPLIRRQWSRKIIGGLLVALVFSGTFLLLLPVAANYMLSRWLENNGADLAEIEDIDINPFNGRITLTGMEIKKGDRRVLANSTVHLDFGLKHLFGRQVRLEQSTLEDIVIDIEQYDDGSLRIGSYHLPAGSARTPEAGSAKPSPPWFFQADDVVLKNALLRFTHSGLPLELQIDAATLERLSTVPEEPAGSLDLRGSLNGAQLAVNIDTLTLAGTTTLTGTAELDGLDLSPAAVLLKEHVSRLSGTAAVAGSFGMTFAQSSGLKTSFSGRVSLDNTDAGGFGWQSTGSFAWDGRVAYQQIAGSKRQITLEGNLAVRDQAAELDSPVLELKIAELDYDGKVEADIDETLRLNASGSALSDSLSLATAQTALRQDTASWQGTLAYETGADAGQAAGIEGRLHLVGLNVSDQTARHIQQGNLFLEGEISFTTTARPTAAEMVFNGTLELEDSGYDDGQLTVQVGRTRWLGKTAFAAEDHQQRLELDGSLELAETGLEDSHGLELNIGGLGYDGQIEADIGEALRLGAYGTAQGDSLFLATEQITLRQDDASWQGRLAYDAGAAGTQSTEMVVTGSLDLEGSGYDDGRFNIQVARTRWQGETALATEDDQKRLELDGSLKLAETDLEEAAQQFRAVAGEVELVPAATIDLAPTPFFNGNSRLAATNLAFSQNREPLLLLGSFTGSLQGSGREHPLLVDSLILGNIVLPASRYLPLPASIDSIELAGIRADPALADVQVHSLDLWQARVEDPASTALMAKVTRATADNLQMIDRQDVTISSVTLGSSTFLSQPANRQQSLLATLDNGTALDLGWSAAGGLAIETITLEDLFATLQKISSSPSSESTAQTQQAPQIEKQEGASAVQPSTGGIPLSIGSITATGDSGLDYADFTLSRPFKAGLDLKKALITDIDLNRPEHFFSYELAATVNNYAPLQVEGKAAPLERPFRLEQQTTLRNYPLVDISSFLIDAMGTEFESGRIQLESELKIAEDRLQADNTVVLNEVKTRTADEETLEAFNAGLPVPLDTALFLLTDKDRNITISLPISGELKTIRVGLGDLVTTALSKAITATVTPYLAYMAIGPGGVLAYLGLQLGKTLIDTDLPAVSFAHASAGIDEKQQEILDNIAVRLTKEFANDPEKNISLCSMVTLAEAGGSDDATLEDERVRKALFRLGDQRAEAVRSYLVDNHGLDTDRLLTCSPGLVFSDDGQGLLEFKK